MPKRIDTDKPGDERGRPFTTHTRSDGSELRYYHPHSPFQRMINVAMERKQLSFREAAKLIGTTVTTLWAWVHNETGYPGRKWNDEILEKICLHLGIRRAELEAAINASRIAYGDKVNPPPASADSAFDDFINILESYTTRRVDRLPLLRLAKRLRAGAAAEEMAATQPPAPAKKKKSRAPGSKKRSREN